HSCFVRVLVRPLGCTLVPYTTLFRSQDVVRGHARFGLLAERAPLRPWIPRHTLYPPAMACITCTAPPASTADDPVATHTRRSNARIRLSWSSAFCSPA